MGFRDFDINGFLRDHWQKKPLLIRNPWSDWNNPIDPGELAGLACEDAIESRLIETRKRQRIVAHGPFAQGRFAKVGKWPWTLLVQAVDHHAPAVAALLAPFRFIPNWRVDDVMVSYASDGGGVGPHFDQYDVFLIQGLGRRRWRIGGMCNSATALLPHEDLRLLATLDAEEEWIVDPGDILYLPPGIAHDGVAVGDDCMTYSVGFRAPSTSDLLSGWCDHLADTLSDDDRYGDPDLEAQGNPGEVSAAALERLYKLATEKLRDRDAFARWFGTYSSTPKYPDMDWAPDEAADAETLRAFLGEGGYLVRNPASRFAFIRGDAGAVHLFVDGQSFDCTDILAPLAEQICVCDRIGPVAVSTEKLALLTALIDQGSLALDEED
ncbi:MAG: cupin domain-containing protein [Sphingobium sp.]